MSKGLTPFKIRCQILTDTWLNFKEDEDFREFFLVNDYGVPLAYLLNNGVIMTSSSIEDLINETWDEFMIHQETEDTGFNSFNHLFMLSEDE